MNEPPAYLNWERIAQLDNKETAIVLTNHVGTWEPSFGTKREWIYILPLVSAPEVQDLEIFIRDHRLLRNLENVYFGYLVSLEISNHNMQSIECLPFLRIYQLKKLILSNNLICSSKSLRKMRCPFLHHLQLRRNHFSDGECMSEFLGKSLTHLELSSVNRILPPARQQIYISLPAQAKINVYELIQNGSRLLPTAFGARRHPSQSSPGSCFFDIY